MAVAPSAPQSLARAMTAKVRTERANAIHQLLVRTMASVLRRHGIEPLYNSLIDLYCDIRGERFMFEMKSHTDENEADQIRKAVSQLYEYRYLQNSKAAQLVIVLSRKPREDWIIDYLVDDRDIAICWLDGDGFGYPIHLASKLGGFLSQ